MPRSKTIKIQLTQGFVAIVDAVDFPKVAKYSWCVDRRPRGLCYANTTIGRRTVRMHQLIFPEAMPERDHRNGDGLDNRRSNLRKATRAQNTHNIRKKLGAIYKGVTYQPRLTMRPWQARIGTTHLGYFVTAEEAAAVYDQAALKQHGEFARVNGISARIKPNHRYKVVAKKFIPNPKTRGRLFVYELACGHSFVIPGFRAQHIGLESRCKACCLLRG